MGSVPDGTDCAVSKGLTFASIITLFTLIIPTIINVIRKWPDADYAHDKRKNSNGSAGLRIHFMLTITKTMDYRQNPIVEGCCDPMAHSTGRTERRHFQ